MDILKSHLNKIKDKFTKSDLQRKLKEATSNEHCHANVSLLDEISSKTSNYTDFQVIVTHCIKKLECKKEKWRKILKTLFLIEHILKTGSPNFVDSMKSEIYKLKNLMSFSFIDPNRTDKGETIREKSKNIVALLEDKSKLKHERENYAKWKGRIEGVSSSGKIGSSVSSSSNNNAKSVSSDSYSGSVSYLDKAESKSKNKNMKEELSSSSESEDEKKKKKKKVVVAKIKEESESSDEEEKNNKKQNMVEEEENKSNTGAKKQNVGLSHISIKKPGVSNVASNSNTQSTNNSNLMFNPFEDNNSNTVKVNQTNSSSNPFDDIFGGGSTTKTNTTSTSTNVSNNNPFNDIFSQNTNTNVNVSQNKVNNTMMDFSNLNISQTNTHQTTQSNNLLETGNLSSGSNQQNKPKVVDLLNQVYSSGSTGNLGYSNTTQTNTQFNNFNNYPFQNQTNNPPQNYWNQNPNTNPYSNPVNNSMNNPYSAPYNNNPMNNAFPQFPQNFPTQHQPQTQSNFSGWNNKPSTYTPYIPKTSNNNDDDFKEVEEDDVFKIGKNTTGAPNKGGLNNLLDPKLVNLNDLKATKKNTTVPQNNQNYYNAANNSSNFNFNF